METLEDVTDERPTSEMRIRAADPVPNPVTAIGDLWRYRELFRSLAEREIFVQYKHTLLGAGWAVLKPLSMMVVFTLVFSYFARVPSEGLPYAIFSYTATVPWAFFSGAVTSGAMSLLNQSALLDKVFFPREAVPLVSIVTHGLDFVIALAIYPVLMAVYHIPPTLHVVGLGPLVAIQVMLTAGLVLLLSAVTVYYRDVRAMLPLGMQLWMYATPIVFPFGLVPERWRTLYAVINPMAPLIDGYRQVLAKGAAPQWGYVAIAALVSVLVLWVGYRFFKALERRFAEFI
jgi:ABC-type polysaccharide/polyol phosphate export permease